jgi:glycosyltransferase involved in cell wall biosynthesis
MRISLIIPSFYPAVIYGGPIFSTLHTCQELVKLENTEIYVSTTNTNMTSKLDVITNTWQKFSDHFFVKYYNETKVDKFSLQLYANIWKDIKQSDVVHIQSIFNTPTPIALFYARIFHKPILLSPRGSLGGWCLDNGSGYKKKWLDWLIKPFADKVIWHATADQERDEILALFPNAKISVIPNGIEYDTFQNSNALSPIEFIQKFTNTTIHVDKIIVSIGRLQKKKGFDILIDAFSRVLEHYPNAKLCIVGGDEGEEKNLRDQIQRLGLENSSFLVGAIGGQDKIDFLANADLFVLPSHNENFGNVYVESLAAGTPIVASLNTPWSEVESADCGKWVANSVEETSKAMLEMLGRNREQMRINSKQTAKKYGWTTIAIQFKELFDEMAEKK